MDSFLISYESSDVEAFAKVLEKVAVAEFASLCPDTGFIYCVLSIWHSVAPQCITHLTYYRLLDLMVVVHTKTSALPIPWPTWSCKPNANQSKGPGQHSESNSLSFYRPRQIEITNRVPAGAKFACPVITFACVTWLTQNKHHNTREVVHSAQTLSSVRVRCKVWNTANIPLRELTLLGVTTYGHGVVDKDRPAHKCTERESNLA